MSVDVAGGYAYVASQSSGLRIINVTNPAAPIEVSSYGSFAEDVVVTNGYAYLAMAGDLLSGSDGVMGLFTPAGLQQVLQRGLSRKADAADFSVYRASHQLWALLQLAAWARMFRVAI